MRRDEPRDDNPIDGDAQFADLPDAFTAAIEHRIETRIQERTAHLEQEIAELEATIESLHAEETADQDDEAETDLDLVTDGGTLTVALEIRADDPEDYAIDDLWIDDIPIGTLIKRSHETSKANKQTIEDTKEDIDSHKKAIRHLNSVVGSDASAASAENDGETTTRQPRDTPLEQLLDDPQRSGIRITESVTRALDCRALQPVVEQPLGWPCHHRRAEGSPEHGDGRTARLETGPSGVPQTR